MMDVVLGELACLSEAIEIDADYHYGVLDIYGPVLGQSPLIEDILRKMRSRVSQELRFQEQLTSLNGALDMVLAQVNYLSSVSLRAYPLTPLDNFAGCTVSGRINGGNGFRG